MTWLVAVLAVIGAAYVTSAVLLVAAYVMARAARRRRLRLRDTWLVVDLTPRRIRR